MTSMDQRGSTAMLSLADYNYEHFRTKHFLADLRTTLHGGGWNRARRRQTLTSKRLTDSGFA